MAKRGASFSQSRKDTGRTNGPAGVIALAGILLATAASWLAIDPRSIDGFDDPKSLLVKAGLAVAAAALFWKRLRRKNFGVFPPRGHRRTILLFFLAAVAAAGISALASAWKPVALATLSTVAIFLLALPAGASEIFERRRDLITRVFLGCAAINALLVLLAVTRLYSPLLVESDNRRAALGAFLGNAGQLGMALALAATCATDALFRWKGKWRWAAAALGGLCLTGMLATLTLTSAGAAAVGITVVLLLRLGRKIVLRLVVAALILATAAAAGPLRYRVHAAATAVREGQWNSLVTGRMAPWFASLEMIRQRPMLGVGAGAFERAYIPARLAAEARCHCRLTLWGLPTSNFGRAHNDYLDLAASCGLLTALLLGIALTLFLRQLIREKRCEPVAILSAALAGAFLWFPFQITTCVLWILLMAGRGFRQPALEEES